MTFEWDKRKNRRNLAKHGVSFEAATLVFDDPHAVGVPYHTEEDEERWKTVGMAAGVVPLLVVHTHREEGGEEYIRIISARKATPRERKTYEEGV
ncbi:MAG TPA: BrnT family toxin [Candidatus Angelobacter sp.]|nr:BrnT family toxin [Candidatus Angelobacter sp.]